MSASSLRDLGEKINDFSLELVRCSTDLGGLGWQMMMASQFQQTDYQQQKFFALLTKLRDDLPRLRAGLDKVIETLGSMPRLGS